MSWINRVSTSGKSSSNIMSTNLGELELRVLETLWERPHLDARQVREALGELRAPSLSTVQSTLERLYRKTYVHRLKQGHAYTYHASVSRSSLLGRILGEVIQLLHDGKMDTILSSFVHAAVDLDDKSLDNLELLIREKRRKQEEERGD
jgi:predicted transcriptional regulator